MLWTQDAVPWWILLAGGVGISLGLAMWGYRVMSTIGTNMTKLTPSRGFNIGKLDVYPTSSGMKL
jgi:PiT family inorganic phosphate transporter